MKTIIKYIILPGVVLGATALLQSCAMEAPFGEGGEGSLSINTEINGETKQTRAENNLDNAEYLQSLQDKCVVFIENSRGVMRKYKGLSNIPASIKLSSGQYVCNAWTGDSVAASFDSKFYRGQQAFEITENANTSVSMKCNIANVVVSIDAASVAETGLKNPKITFTSSRGSLEFDETMFAESKGYFMIPSPADTENYTAENRTITVKIEGTTEDGQAYSKEHKIENVERAHEYQIALSADQPSIDEGGVLIQLVIKDIPIIDDTVEIFPAPIVNGYGFDIAEQLINTDRTFNDQMLYICEYKGTKSVMVAFSDNFTDMADGDLLNNTYVEQLSAKGITVERQNSKDAESGVDVYEIYVTFPAAFLNALPSSVTQYMVAITATDSRNLVTAASLRIANSNDAIEKTRDATVQNTGDVEQQAEGEKKATEMDIMGDYAYTIVIIDKLVMFLSLVVFRVGWWGTIFVQQVLLGMLTIFGPLLWAFSILPKWEGAWAKWITRYLTVHFYGAMLYFVGFYVLLLFDIVVNIQIETLNGVLANQESLSSYISHAMITSGYLLVASIVALKCLNLVPDLAAWMIPEGDTAFSTRNFGEGVASGFKGGVSSAVSSINR